VRPRTSHRRGNDALLRGLCPGNDPTRESLGRSPRTRCRVVQRALACGGVPDGRRFRR
jgi:hypothetical protein